MDFFQISTREIEKGPKKGQFEVFPDFIVGKTKDLMVRGRAFRAIYDEEEGLWSTDEYDVQRLVDHEVLAYVKEHDIRGNVKLMRSFGTNLQTQFRKYVSQISDNSHELDENLTFANTPIKKTDYVSRRLPYSLAPGDISAWDELVGTLYSPEERAKIEWAIGSVVAGDSKKIQKFVVFYGSAGTGKSTILNIIQKLFAGYTTTFEAKALGSNNNAFATEVFRHNPLVAIQHDGDLSKIDDNTKLNSIISHEEMTMNEKYKPSYDASIRAFLFMGTNQPVKISDAKSGIIRRLIDVQPTGVKLAPNHYHALMARIEFELGAIAHHCLQRYREMGKNYYNSYQPLEMMFQTDIFFNYIEWNYDLFKEQDGVSLKQAYALYKEFCDATGIDKGRLPQYKFREELRNYFGEFHDRISLGGETIRSYYRGFKSHQFKVPVNEDPKTWALTLDETISLLDLECAEMPAQLAKEDGTPRQRWSEVKTTLAEIDTSEIHYVKIGGKQIVMDLDLKGADGRKSLERNLARAAEFPATYAELSKSGSGVHLHYIYDGEPEDLAREFEPGIEIKVFSGGSSLRRRLSFCNNVPIATISDGLPLKEKKAVLSATTVQSDRGLRELIARNLRKEIHPGTKPSIDFIHKILQDAYEGNFEYDVTDLRPRVIAFANNSTNQSLACLEKVLTMKWKSDDSTPPFAQPYQTVEKPTDDRLVFFDIEVYPNLFVICWNYDGSDDVVRMINPGGREIEALLKLKLVGFNNRRYDNHILYAAMLGYDNEALYKLSKKIISGSVGSMFAEAYKISWADVYDFSSLKMGLKKFEILLGLKHKELDFDWDQPVPEEFWEKVVEYCVNDVLATKAVFHARKQDWIARLILAELAGMTPNDTTQKLTSRIVFNGDHNPQKSFVYTDLSKEFPGYTFEKGVSTYRGEVVGEGGYVYAEPGIYEDVALLDVASMHPTSIIRLNAFGEYTPRFAEIVEARLAIKAKDYDRASTLLGGRLAKYLTDREGGEGLANALKIAINIVYGLTSAKFDNPFRDLRNVDNIVAKRGALFMIELKHFVQERGFRVVHIKTDSIKIPGATDEIIEDVKRFGEKYGYTFEYNPVKDHYEKFALVNDAVYVAKSVVPATLGDNTDAWTSKWIAVGAQFQHPYVFKTLFDTSSPITFDDLCETKQVSKGGLYLDFEGAKPMVLSQIPAEMQFIGRTGRFTPVKEDWGGGILYRVQDGKAYAASGTKGHFWVESDVARDIYDRDAIDMTYFEKLVEDARKTLEKFGNVEELIG